MYTKWLLTLAGSLCFCYLSLAQSSAPLAIQINDCQSLEVKLNTSSSSKGATLPYTFMLEKAVASDLWQKVKTVHSSKRRYHFTALSPATYRVRLLDQNQAILSFSTSQVKREKGYLLSEEIVLSEENCNQGLTSNNAIKRSRSALQVYPNPTRQQIQVEWPKAWLVQSLKLYTLTGKALSQYSANANFIRLDLTGIPRGIYLLQLQTTDGQSHTQRISILP